MRRSLLVVLALFGFCSFVVPQSAAHATARPPLNSQLQRVVDLVNQRRHEAGLAPVTIHPVLMSCAQQYSEVQAAQGAISHTGPDGSKPGQRMTRCGYRWRVYGENLAAGFSNPDELVAAWMNSPGHRKVILLPRVREIGVGHTHRADDPSYYYDYHVLLVGLRK
jgi:uncharacterized protein YkwD